MKRLNFIFIILITFISCKHENSYIKLPSLFSDHMVLQQNTEVSIWGWSDPEKTIEISTEWGEKNTVIANSKGKWLLKIATPKAGGPYSITLKSGDFVKIISDIYVGEVWIASGQSNMEMPLKGWEGNPIDHSKQEIVNSDFPRIRIFTVKREISDLPVKDCKGEWQVSNPENSGNFSATAYFFAKQIYEKLKVPVGIIHSSWGGTPAEAWTSKSFVAKIKGFEDVDKQLADVKESQKQFEKWANGLQKEDLSVASENIFKDPEMDKRYSSSSLDDSGWEEMNLPSRWESQQLKRFDGIVWFRKNFTISEYVDLSHLKLFLGKIDDMDDTYINGIQVGSTLKPGFWDKDRTYAIPSEILHSGKNSISIKVIDNYGGGGVYGKNKIGILNSRNDTIIDMSGKWKFKPVSLFHNESVYQLKDKKSYQKVPKAVGVLNSNFPTVLYNGMIAPLIPYTIKGAIWYQGESNVGRAEQYKSLFPTMIESWRKVWGLGDFPFYYVQIAPFKYSNNNSYEAAELRYAQFLTLNEKNVGMVVTTDIGEINNIHPANKQDVGKRLALWALNKTYGFDHLICSGPLFKSSKYENNKAIISFSNTVKGLVMKGDRLKYFEIAGEDNIFYKAKARIKNDHQIVVSSKKVKHPLHVRFGWTDTATPNLFNSSGLPASPFKD